MMISFKNILLLSSLALLWFSKHFQDTAYYACIVFGGCMLFYSLFIQKYFGQNNLSKERNTMIIGLSFLLIDHFSCFIIIKPLTLIGVIIIITGYIFKYQRVRSIRGLFKYDWSMIDFDKSIG